MQHNERGACLTSCSCETLRFPGGGGTCPLFKTPRAVVLPKKYNQLTLAKLSSSKVTLCLTCYHFMWYRAASLSAKFTALEKQQPLDPSQYGWEADLIAKIFVPTYIFPDINIAPKSLLKILRCDCGIDEPCKSKCCFCHNNDSGCNTFCKCVEGGKDCQHPFTQSPDDNDSPDNNLSDEDE